MKEAVPFDHLRGIDAMRFLKARRIHLLKRKCFVCGFIWASDLEINLEERCKKCFLTQKKDSVHVVFLGD